MHVGASPGDLHHDHPTRSVQTVGEALRERAGGGRVRAFGVSHRDDLGREHEHVSPFEPRPVLVEVERVFGERHERIVDDGNGRELRMKAEDRAGEKRLTMARRRGHGREHHTVSENDLRVALEAPVGQRRHRKEFRHLDTRPPIFGTHAGHEHLGQLLLGDLLGLVVHRRSRLAEQHFDHPIARFRVGEGLDQKFLRLEHFDAQKLQHAAEHRVLFAGTITEENVVEEKFVHHGRNHDVDLASRLVDEHLAEATDFRGDVKHAGDPPSLWPELLSNPRTRR